jgi:THO complex subunit 4
VDLNANHVQVEVVVSSAELIPQPKTLAQRIAQPKAQPKSAATVKQNGANAKGGAAAGKATKKTARRGRSNRPVKKTAEELDSEMADYFDNANTENNANAAAPAAAAGGDAPMEEDVL